MGCPPLRRRNYGGMTRLQLPEQCCLREDADTGASRADAKRGSPTFCRWTFRGPHWRSCLGRDRSRREPDTKVTKRGEGRRPVVQAWCASGATGARRFSYQFLSRNSPSKIGSSLGETRKQKKKDPGPFLPLRGLGVGFLISILSLPLPLPKLFPQQFPPPSFTPSASFRFRLEI